MMKEPTRLYTAFSGIFLFMQGTLLSSHEKKLDMLEL
jgi:hypothetical protein